MMEVKQLGRLQTCALFPIDRPIWGGGKRCVGLDVERVSQHNEITIGYTRKSDGQKSYPDHYYIDRDTILSRDYPKQAWGQKTLVLVPINDLMLLERV